MIRHSFATHLLNGGCDIRIFRNRARGHVRRRKYISTLMCTIKAVHVLSTRIQVTKLGEQFDYFRICHPGLSGVLTNATVRVPASSAIVPLNFNKSSGSRRLTDAHPDGFIRKCLSPHCNSGNAFANSARASSRLVGLNRPSSFKMDGGRLLYQKRPPAGILDSDSGTLI